ncbi:hypothetical protein ZHAS_00017698 [Anopheles sinensis]|uniref:Uncharacterized protein n=1 Tax=Anopheles sinensis TaxID=74873 RepID=A0A084WH02_ANOSI|nr:hypothetical protein ZHAS_00017698 [Anopheles sinensis]
MIPSSIALLEGLAKDRRESDDLLESTVSVPYRFSYLSRFSPHSVLSLQHSVLPRHESVNSDGNYLPTREREVLYVGKTEPIKASSS